MITSEQMLWRSLATSKDREQIVATIEATNEAAGYEGRGETPSTIKDVAFFTLSKNMVDGFAD